MDYNGEKKITINFKTNPVCFVFDSQMPASTLKQKKTLNDPIKCILNLILF